MSEIEIGVGIALTPPEEPFTVTGLTFTKERSQGIAGDWLLTVKGRPSITVRDITWEVGERDIRTIMSEQLPEMPREMAKFYERRRAGVYYCDAYHTWMTARTITFQPDGWPLHQQQPTLDALDAVCDAKFIQAACRLGITDIGPKGEVITRDRPGKGELCALFEPDCEEGTHAAFYAVTRILPVLRHIGWVRVP
ncbi:MULTISPECIES: hypothetical protein [Streptomyces]|uniref:hypothetical protein n=1 Tax=Streptomyces TaxID=1883 RepID=UPI000366522D|nr:MULTISPECIES: hypothetical protein [Streptomyces]MZD19606.1 hypothetical protein [Streptomyces sp. SID5476]